MDDGKLQDGMVLSRVKLITVLTETYDVNEHLQLGWVMLKCYTASYAPDDCYPCYVLGWDKQGEPVRPPSKYPELPL